MSAPGIRNYTNKGSSTPPPSVISPPGTVWTCLWHHWRHRRELFVLVTAMLSIQSARWREQVSSVHRPVVRRQTRQELRKASGVQNAERTESAFHDTTFCRSGECLNISRWMLVWFHCHSAVQWFYLLCSLKPLCCNIYPRQLQRGKISVCRPVCLYAEFLIKFRFSGVKLGMLVVLTFWHHQPLGRGIVKGAKLLNMKFDPGNDSAEKSNQYAGTREEGFGGQTHLWPNGKAPEPSLLFHIPQSSHIRNSAIKFSHVDPTNPDNDHVSLLGLELRLLFPYWRCFC